MYGNNIYKILALAAMTAGAAGCVDETLDICPPAANVTMHFRLPDQAAENGCAFHEKIRTVTTTVYNAAGDIVKEIDTTAEDHNRFQGVEMYLEPGQSYRVVSWANRSDGVTEEHEKQQGLARRGAHIGYHPDNEQCEGDELYYAPRFEMTREESAGETRVEISNEDGEYEFFVDTATGHESTLDFRHAHRHIKVNVQGFESSGSREPVVELTGLPDALTFLGMRRHGNSTAQANMPSTLGLLPGVTGEWAQSDFTVFYLHSADYDINVNLRDPDTGEVKYSVPMGGHYNLDLDDPENQIDIEVFIKIVGVNVSVIIPDWENVPTDPGW